MTRIGTSSYELGCRIVDTEGTVYSKAEVKLVAFDTRTQQARPLSEAERARLESTQAP